MSREPKFETVLKKANKLKIEFDDNPQTIEDIISVAQNKLDLLEDSPEEFDLTEDEMYNYKKQLEEFIYKYEKQNSEQEDIDRNLKTKINNLLVFIVAEYNPKWGKGYRIEQKNGMCKITYVSKDKNEVNVALQRIEDKLYIKGLNAKINNDEKCVYVNE